jgi:DNA-binding beta-propeller fold protein YncE
MRWRTRVDGFKADHATISPDGKHLIVSATTVDKANVIDTATGEIVTSFPTGNFPHQNDYSADGRFIYNGSIGDVSLPPSLGFAKGARRLTVADAKTFEVVRTYEFSEGIRPAVFTPDGKTMYAELSYFNGVIEYDLTTGTTRRTVSFPLSPFALENYPSRADYPHDSAYHGLAMSQDGRKLCAAGTIDNTVAIVSVDTFQADKIVDVGLIPYWSTTGAKRKDGRDLCFVSLSGDDSISVIDYRDPAPKEVQRIPVGHFPQRTRLGRVSQGVVDLLER